MGRRHEAQEKTVSDGLAHLPERLFTGQTEGLVFPGEDGVVEDFFCAHLGAEVECPGEDAGDVCFACEGDEAVNL